MVRAIYSGVMISRLGLGEERTNANEGFKAFGLVPRYTFLQEGMCRNQLSWVAAMKLNFRDNEEELLNITGTFKDSFIRDT